MHEIAGHLRYFVVAPGGEPEYMLIRLKSGALLIDSDHTAEVYITVLSGGDESGLRSCREVVTHMWRTTKGTHLGTEALLLTPQLMHPISTIHKSHGHHHPLRLSRPHQHDALIVKHPERHDWARLDVHWKGKEQEAPVAILHKKWGEGGREQLTDADSYDVEFLFLEDKWRPVVFAAVLVVDWLYFKRL